MVRLNRSLKNVLHIYYYALGVNNRFQTLWRESVIVLLLLSNLLVVITIMSINISLYLLHERVSSVFQSVSAQANDTLRLRYLIIKNLKSKFFIY